MVFFSPETHEFWLRLPLDWPCEGDSWVEGQVTGRPWWHLRRSSEMAGGTQGRPCQEIAL